MAVVSGYFRVRARVEQTNSGISLVFPEMLSRYAYGQLAVNPNDPGDAVFAVSAKVEELTELAQQEGIQALNETEMRNLIGQWGY